MDLHRHSGRVNHEEFPELRRFAPMKKIKGILIDLDGVGETMVARFVAELGNVLRETAGAG